jgi:hypothetical protein
MSEGKMVALGIMRSNNNERRRKSEKKKKLHPPVTKTFLKVAEFSASAIEKKAEWR